MLVLLMLRFTATFYHLTCTTTISRVILSTFYFELAIFLCDVWIENEQQLPPFQVIPSHTFRCSSGLSQTTIVQFCLVLEIELWRFFSFRLVVWPVGWPAWKYFLILRRVHMVSQQIFLLPWLLSSRHCVHKTILSRCWSDRESCFWGMSTTCVCVPDECRDCLICCLPA